ncbi:MAG TPA: phospholipid carrier-dependent glycosyltransferase [Microbacteriaceae bacterium]|nr:phospholipid carrier-dependent glycosyltransferase [Microbacteriaceae bacterium]
MTAERLDGPRTGSRLDDWFSRTVSTPIRQRIWHWGLPIAVTLLAAVLRLWDLGSPRALVFDETYYVKDAYSLSRLGYEGSWAKAANPQFEQGITTGLSTDPSFVVHPPLGKWLISLGIQWFGVENPMGWRITTALAGIIAVWLVIAVARRLMQSTLLASIAGLLLAVDGSAVVMSRVAILDNWVMLFVLIGAAAVLADRAGHERRLAERFAWAQSGGHVHPWGPVFWWRPWLLAAGLAFGAATAVKWSGLWFLAGFGVYLVAVDALARRRVGFSRGVRASLFAQGPVSFVTVVAPGALVYLASWTGWLLTSGGWNRNWASLNGYTGPFPNWLASLGYYHQQAYNYHVSLTSHHPYQANPLTWLFMIRPTSMYYEGATFGENGCTFDSCSSAITGIGNPLIWWAATIAAGYLYYRLIMRREWQVGFMLVGLAAGYLPWLNYLNRTVFEFYTIAFEPFLILGLTWCLGLVLGTAADARERRTRNLALVAVYLSATVAVSAFFVPLMTGMQVPFWFWNAHMWLPSWR